MQRLICLRSWLRRTPSLFDRGPKLADQALQGGLWVTQSPSVRAPPLHKLYYIGLSLFCRVQFSQRRSLLLRLLSSGRVIVVGLGGSNSTSILLTRIVFDLTTGLDQLHDGIVALRYVFKEVLV